MAFNDFLITKRSSTNWTVSRLFTRFSTAHRSEEVACYPYRKTFDSESEALEYAAKMANKFHTTKKKSPTSRFYIVKKIATPITYTEGN